MILKNKKALLSSSLLILLPSVVGLLLLDRFPEQITTHWSADGTPDGWSSAPVFVLTMPVFLLALQWLCIWATSKDPGNKNRNAKPVSLVLWIVPLLSNLACGMTYALALGMEFSPERIFIPAMGLLFAVIGNYLPKFRMNSTLGIRIPWTYSSEENWNATHRLAGKLWVAGGILIVLGAFLPGELPFLSFLTIMFLLILVPVVYSWRFYKKQLANQEPLKPLPRMAPRKKQLTVIFSMALVIFLGFILLGGDVTVQFGETGFTVDSIFWDALTVDYAAVDSLEFREGNVPGRRVSGFGSWKLLLGSFENEEFGIYTRYTVYRPDGCIVAAVGDRVLVLSGENQAETREIFEALQERIS